MTPSPVRPVPRRTGRDRPVSRRGATWLVVPLLLAVFAAGVLVGQGGRGPALLGAVGAAPSPGPSVVPDIAQGLDEGLLDEAVRIIVGNYVDPDRLGEEDLTRGAIRGMVESLGDTGHTIYLTPEEVRAELQALDGRLTGIGVMVDSRSETPVIIAVFDGSPADRAGIRVGDTIVSVDGERADRMTISELLRRVRGEAGTTVVVGIQHRDGTTVDLPIVRAEIDVPAVSWAVVPGTTVADVRFVQFQTGAADEMRTAIERALEAGATGIVLDLRGNPGGLVDEAVAIAGMFLPDGSVVYRQQDRTGERQAVTTRGAPIAPDVPVIVLVDAGSASSAEILAGALQDAGRARVLGQRTFGTGTVLNFFPLSDGSAIRLGVIEWLTASGAGIFETGIGPDVAVAMPEDGTIVEPADLRAMDRPGFRRSTDTQLRRAVRLLEREAPDRAR